MPNPPNVSSMFKYFHCLFPVLLLTSSLGHAKDFGNDITSSWAETPRGKFECRNDESTKNLQLLKLGGQTIYRESGINNPQGSGGPTLSSGIKIYDPGCPTIFANNKGYVVIVRSTQPPHYGVNGYGIIDFNRQELLVIELGEGQHPQDTRIKHDSRLKWTDTGVTLKFFGYLMTEEAPGGLNSPKPKAREVHYDFSSGKVSVIK